MRIHRYQVQAMTPALAGAALVTTGAMLPAVALPCVGAGLAMFLGMSSSRRAIAGWAIGVVGAGASLPVAETAGQRTATAVLLGWTIVGTFGWRRSMQARQCAETAVDTVLLNTTGAPAEQGAPQIVRALADILGATSGRIETIPAPAAATAVWNRRTQTVFVPLIAAGLRAGTVVLNGVARPAPWQLTLTNLVASRWAEQALAHETAERLLRPEAIDPVTGLGNEQAVAVGLASLAPGDSVIALRLEDLTTTRATEGEGRADLLVCQLGLHVRNRLRGTDIVARYADDRFVVICRNPNGETPAIIDRVLSAWPVWEAGHRILAMSAVHDEARSPLETLEAALDPIGHSGLDDTSRSAAENVFKGVDLRAVVGS